MPYFLSLLVREVIELTISDSFNYRFLPSK